MTCEIAALVLWIFQQLLYRVECSHCPPRTKNSQTPRQFSHWNILHYLEAEIKPSLSVIKESLIGISAAFGLLPLPLKPLTWREVLSLHHISSVMGQDLTRGFKGFHTFSRFTRALKWMEKGLMHARHREFKIERNIIFMDRHRLAFGTRAHIENWKAEPGWEAAELNRIFHSG